MDKLDELFPTRNYNRAIELPCKDNEADETDLYPNATKRLILHVREITSEVVEETEKKIEEELSEVEGFLEVADQKQKNKDRVMKVISEDGVVSKIESKIAEVCKSLDIESRVRR